MKLNIRDGACIGCGACVAIDPTHFDFNDDGLAEVIYNEELDTNSVINALESCPTNAIYTDEDCNCECNCGNNCECTPENKCSDNCDCNTEKSE